MPQTLSLIHIFRSLNFSLCPSIIQILSFLCNSHTAFPAFFSMNLKPFPLRSSQYVHFTQNNPHGVEPAYAFSRGLAGFYFTCVQIGIHVIMIPTKMCIRDSLHRQYAIKPRRFPDNARLFQHKRHRHWGSDPAGHENHFR